MIHTTRRADLTIPPDDYQRVSPGLAGANYAKNLAVVHVIGELAREKGCTASHGPAGMTAVDG